MKNIRGNFIIELGVLNNTRDLYNLKYGWDREEGILSENQRTIGTGSYWGLVYNEYDIRHDKLVVKMEDGDFDQDFLAVNGVKEVSEEELRLFGALVEGSTVSIAEISVNLEDATESTIVERYASKTIENALDFGIILEKEGLEFTAYASSSSTPAKDKLVSFEFDSSKWDKVVLGVWGYSNTIDDILGFRRIMPNDFNILKDYEIRWEEGGILKAWVSISEEKLIDFAERGNKAAIYLRPKLKEVEKTDLYGETEMYFGGIITDINERESSYEFDLESYRHFLDFEYDKVILDNLEVGNVELRDYFDALEDIYEELLPIPISSYDYPSKSSRWHNNNDRVLSIKGSALDAEREHLYYGGMGVRVEPITEMTELEVEVFETGDGENKVVKSDLDADNPEENIISNIDIKKLSREDVYVNLLKLSGSADDRDRRIFRERRFEKFMNIDVELDIEKGLDLSDFSGTEDELVGVAEQYLDMQEDGIVGDIRLVGHHPYLAGLFKNGSLTITDSTRDIYEEEVRITGMIVNRGNTEFEFTQSPMMEKKEEIEEISESIRYADIESVYDSASETQMVVKIDEPMLIDPLNIDRVGLETESDSTKMVEVRPREYRGYVYIDFKLNKTHYSAGQETSPTKIIFHSVGQEVFYELENFYSKGNWMLDGVLVREEDEEEIESEIHITIAIMQDLIIEEPRETTFTFGERAGGFGDPDAGGGHFAKPKRKLRIDEIKD